MPDTGSTPDRAPQPPVCPGLPFIGNARQLLADPCAFLTGAHRLLGPVFRVRAATQAFSVISGEAARRFMAEGLDESCLTRHPIFDPLEREFGSADFVMAHTGWRHTRLRAPLAVSFSRHVASAFIEGMIEVVRAEVRRWEAGSRVTVIEQTQRLSFAQWCFLLGPGAARLRQPDCQRLSAYWMMVGATLLPPAIFRLPWYRRSHRRSFAVFRDLVRDARRRAPRAGAAPNVLEALLSARDAADVTLSDDEVVTYLAYGTLGACAYVARLTAFMLYEIARDRALMADVRSEAQAAFAAGIRDAPALRGMRLLYAVYQETLRRHPVSPGMPFVTARDFEFEGCRFPRGESTVISPVALAFAPESFVDPDRFDPSRCREPRNEHRKGRFYPFGLGNRTCVAAGLVEIMATTIVAAVISERETTLEPPGYVLGLTALPLPSPNRKLRLRVGGTPAWGALAPTEPPEEVRLASFAGHDDPAVRAALATARAERFPRGAVIVREGDVADAYYLIQAGGAVVTQSASAVPVAELGVGDGFGELGLLQNAPRNATVTAGDAGAETLVLGRDAFLTMIAASDLVGSEIRALMQKRVAANRLRQVSPGLSAAAVSRVLPDFTWLSLPPGAVIAREGEPAHEFFVIAEGSVVVSRRAPEGEDTMVAVLGPGDYFGEIGLLHRTPRNATVTVASDGPASLLRTDAAGFDRLLNQSGPAGIDLAQAMLSCAERLGSSGATSQ